MRTPYFTFEACFNAIVVEKTPTFHRESASLTSLAQKTRKKFQNANFILRILLQIFPMSGTGKQEGRKYKNGTVQQQRRFGKGFRCQNLLELQNFSQNNSNDSMGFFPKFPKLSFNFTPHFPRYEGHSCRTHGFQKPLFAENMNQFPKTLSLNSCEAALNHSSKVRRVIQSY